MDALDLSWLSYITSIYNYPCATSSKKLYQRKLTNFILLILVLNGTCQIFKQTILQQEM